MQAEVTRAHAACAKAMDARRSKETGESPYDVELRRCAVEGDAFQVKHFLRLGANANASNYNGDTALHMAAMTGHSNCVPVIVEWQGNIIAANSAGDTPLHLAARAEQMDAVRVLVAQKADMEAKNLKGDTPMMCAAIADAKGTVRLLNDFGAYGNWAPPPIGPDLPGVGTFCCRN